MKTVLGIETSCDDTSVAIVQGDGTERPALSAMETFSQDELLGKWGGVIPEIAARNHLAKIAPLLKSVFHKAALAPGDLDAVAVTTAPGLLGPLLTGLGAAKTLSLIFELPVVAVNHVYAHTEAIHLEEPVAYPYLGMVVSGGHSFYALVRSPERFDILGKTLDDAAGEAFDKGGKMLGLGYPAGATIDRLAQEARDKNAYRFPRRASRFRQRRSELFGAQDGTAPTDTQRRPAPEGETQRSVLRLPGGRGRRAQTQNEVRPPGRPGSDRRRQAAHRRRRRRRLQPPSQGSLRRVLRGRPLRARPLLHRQRGDDRKPRP